MPYGTRKKKNLIGRDKAAIRSDCIACKSTRTVQLVVSKGTNEHSATGRCSECGHTSFVTALAQDEFAVVSNGAVLRRVHDDDGTDGAAEPLSLSEV